MTELVFLQGLVVIVAAAVAVVACLRSLQAPSIVGFIGAGTVVGPNAPGLVQDLHPVERLAELGVLLPLLGIGLELSLSRVGRLWRPMQSSIGCSETSTTVRRSDPGRRPPELPGLIDKEGSPVTE